MSSALIVNESLLIKNEHPRFPSESEEFKHACFGPDLEKALNSDMNPKVLVEQMKAEGQEFPLIYMACGKEDFLVAENQEFSKFLDEKEVVHTFETGPGAHEWDFWDTYIKRAIEWLPLEKKEAGMSSGNIM